MVPVERMLHSPSDLRVPVVMLNEIDSGFVEVYVEPHDEIPDGASMRYKAESKPERIHRVNYESDDGEEGVWAIQSPDLEGRDAGVYQVIVEDSGAGTSALIFGDEYGLRLKHEDTGTVVAEAYLLLDPDDVVD
jgi:hypothetical protein